MSRMMYVAVLATAMALISGGCRNGQSPWGGQSSNGPTHNSKFAVHRTMPHQTDPFLHGGTNSGQPNAPGMMPSMSAQQQNVYAGTAASKSRSTVVNAGYSETASPFEQYGSPQQAAWQPSQERGHVIVPKE